MNNGEHKSSTASIIAALRELSRTVESGDGVANAALAEAAERMHELNINSIRYEWWRYAATRVELQGEILHGKLLSDDGLCAIHVGFSEIAFDDYTDRAMEIAPCPN